MTTSDPVPVGQVLLASDAVRKLTFTGSTEVGKSLAAQAAGTVKRVSLELGGHAPFLVFDDADPAHAAKGAALVKFLNTGQACISPNRIFVQRGIYPEFVRRADRAGARPAAGQRGARGRVYRPADRPASARQDGAATSATRVAKGARLLAGGQRLAGAEFDGGHLLRARRCWPM